MSLTASEGDLGAVVAWLNEQRLTQPAELHRRLTILEGLMASTDDKLAELTANLDNIAGDVQWLKDEAQRLQDELAAQEPGLAAKLQPLVDRTRALADSVPDQTATPPAANPEPTPEPEPPTA